MTKFRKLLDLERYTPDPNSELHPQLPHSTASSPQLPEKVLIAPRRKPVAQLPSSLNPAPPVQARPKQISAQAYRLAPIARSPAVSPAQVAVTVEIAPEILQQAQQILSRSEEASLSTLVESLLVEWVEAQREADAH